MNSGFNIRPLTLSISKNRVGYDKIDVSMVPKFSRREVTFESMAPAWLINGIRSVAISYVPTKRLRVIKESFRTTDQTIMPEFLIETVELIMCSSRAPVNSKYIYSAKSGSSAIVILQAANFKPVLDSNAINNAFDGSIIIGHMTINSSISFEAIVVEEPAYKSPIKPIETDFAFYPTRAMEIYRENTDADVIFEMREELDKPPYFVRFIAHGCDENPYAPFITAISIINKTLLAWKESINLPSALVISGRRDDGIIEHSWRVDEPLNHIATLLRGVLLTQPKKYRSVILQHDHIISTTTFRIVFVGSGDDLRADLRERIDETIEHIAKFNLPPP